VNPAPFMRPLGSRDFGTGNVYEMRIYTFAPGDIAKIEGWAKAIEAREKFSPLACWASELGGLHKFTHCTGILTSEPASARNRAERVALSRHRPAYDPCVRKTSS
jgi:hypothetical protein